MAGSSLGCLSDYKFAQSLFIGTALCITAVPVAIRVLMDLGKLESQAGRTIVSAAIFDDVLSLNIGLVFREHNRLPWASV